MCASSNAENNHSWEQQTTNTATCLVSFARKEYQNWQGSRPL